LNAFIAATITGSLADLPSGIDAGALGYAHSAWTWKDSAAKDRTAANLICFSFIAGNLLWVEK